MKNYTKVNGTNSYIQLINKKIKFCMMDWYVNWELTLSLDLTSRDTLREEPKEGHSGRDSHMV